MSQDPQLFAAEIQSLNEVKAGVFKQCAAHGGHPTMQNSMRLFSDQIDLAYLTLTNVGGTLNFIETQPEAEVAAGNVHQFPEGGASNGAS
tara:strand:+ start:4670 stop:4939 length:270 start_codon:yes stop_codon:yes gene_type:complete